MKVVSFPSKEIFMGFDTSDELMQAVEGCPSNRLWFEQYYSKMHPRSGELECIHNNGRYEGANTECLMLRRIDATCVAVFEIKENYAIKFVDVFDPVKVANEKRATPQLHLV